MEIIRGNLEDISRPASSEQSGSRVSSVSLPRNERISPTTPFSLVVLNNDASNIQIRTSSGETMMGSSATDPDRLRLPSVHSPENFTGEEKEDSELQKAIEEMRRLDDILSEKICREREVRRQRKELQSRLWQELLQGTSPGHTECVHEALNTRLFLALEAPSGAEEEEDFVPVFETQVLDSEHVRDGSCTEQSEMIPESWTESSEVGQEETVQEQFEGSCCGTSKGKTKQKDFVRRNIEFVSGEGGQVFLTQAERERLDEILREADEEEEDNARGGDSEDLMWAVSVPTGQGYTPEPSDQEQLNDIDSRIRPYLPVEEFLSVQSSFTNLGGMSEGHSSQVGGWTCDKDRQPGEKVLQDIKERRRQDRRLQEIQQQLELLGEGQEMTEDSPGLSEEQLISLLNECELKESCTLDTETPEKTQEKVPPKELLSEDT